MRTHRQGKKWATSIGDYRFRVRPRIETLEERSVPSHLRTGTILVATSPNADPNSPSAIVAVDPHGGAQTLVSSGGAFVEPLDLREAPNGGLYVMDGLAMQNGAVFAVNPDTGAQTLISTGGVFMTPTGIQPVGGQLYITDEGTAAAAGDIVRVNPQTGAQKVIASGGQLCAPDGLTAGPHGSLYVVDFNALTTGAVFQIDVHTGAQRLIATGGYIDSPVDVSVDFSGDLIVSNTGTAAGVSNVVRVDPQTGAQTLIAQGGNVVNVNASTLSADGKVLVSSFADTSGSPPAAVVAVNPRTGKQKVLTQGGFLDFLGGLIVYQRPDVPGPAGPSPGLDRTIALNPDDGTLPDASLLGNSGSQVGSAVGAAALQPRPGSPELTASPTDTRAAYVATPPSAGRQALRDVASDVADSDWQVLAAHGWLPTAEADLLAGPATAW